MCSSSRPTAGCLPWSRESQLRAALMCGWPLRSAAATPGEAGSAGSRLARPAVEQRTFAITMFVDHVINLHESSTYSVLVSVMGVKDLVFGLKNEVKGRYNEHV